jgi:hypothetical protein
MTFPGSPRLVKGGIVLMDTATGSTLRVITLQYNSDSMSRTLAIQGAGGGSDGANRSEPLRLKGPPIETIKIEAELDATDQLEMPDQNPTAVSVGLLPQIAALETIIYPSSQTLLNNLSLSQEGTLEIIPMEAPLTLFVWSKQRIMPVRFTELSVTEEAFDTHLHPIRAKISLGMRVLTLDDFPATHRGTSLYMAYQQQKEALAKRSPGGSLDAMGIGGLL